MTRRNPYPEAFAYAAYAACVAGICSWPIAFMDGVADGFPILCAAAAAGAWLAMRRRALRLRVESGRGGWVGAVAVIYGYASFPVWYMAFYFAACVRSSLQGRPFFAADRLFEAFGIGFFVGLLGLIFTGWAVIPFGAMASAAYARRLRPATLRRWEQGRVSP